MPYEVSAPAEVAPHMTELAARRPDLVKIWVDDHFRTLPKIALPVSTAIIEAAHASKLRAVAHVFYLQDAKDLVAAGLDGFAHSVRDTLIDDATLAAMKARGTWLMSATLAREASMFAFARPEPLLSDPFFARSVPEKVQALMGTPEYRKRVTADPHFAGYPTYLKHAQQNLKKLADAGVRFGFGTDTGPPNRFGGYGEHWELALMVEAGLTPSQVITAATRSGAEFLQAPDLGTSNGQVGRPAGAGRQSARGHQELAADQRGVRRRPERSVTGPVMDHDDAAAGAGLDRRRFLSALAATAAAAASPRAALGAGRAGHPDHRHPHPPLRSDPAAGRPVQRPARCTRGGAAARVSRPLPHARRAARRRRGDQGGSESLDRGQPVGPRGRAA